MKRTTRFLMISSLWLLSLSANGSIESLVDPESNLLEQLAVSGALLAEKGTQTPQVSPFYLPLRTLPPRPEQPLVQPKSQPATKPDPEFTAKHYTPLFKITKPLGRPLVAIIIDDIGYNRRQGLAALALPGDITYALIPYSPNALSFAKAAAQQDKELMLHSPMSDIHDHPVSEGGLTLGMSQDDITQTLIKSIHSLPNIRGMNNHQGSLLTQHDEPMRWVMDVLKAHDLYFVDSRTTHKSVAHQVASSMNIPSLSRDIFLDHERTEDFMQKQFHQLIATAKRQGYAVGIGHPYPETIQFLSKNLAYLESNGISLVSISKILSHSEKLVKK